ncbi:FG-GAP-like repeat-containing protein [Deinococcus sp. ME38]|uniref:FG-GAP-like repeat-containing protein n=1 Tax=Deinococcus sp. ME38 TaxID=3400344 RepID=UPI003B598F1E
MTHSRLHFALLGTLLLAACAQPQSTFSAPTPTQVTPARPTPVGAPVTVTFSGLGTPDFDAALTTPLAPLALTDRQGTVTPVRVLSRGSVDLIPPGRPRTEGFRYVYAVVSVTSTAALSNVSFMGVRTTGTLPAGTNDTAISTLIRAPGAPAYTAAEAGTLALSARPTQASIVEPTTGQLQTLPNTTDTVQYLPEADLFTPPGMTGLLPYGFTVLSSARERTLSTAPEGNRMVIGMKLPLQANAQDDPYAFSFTAIPVSDSAVRVTQTVEGLASGDSALVRARAAALGATLTVPSRSPVVGTPLLDLRVAGGAGAATANLFPPVNVGVAGVNSTFADRTGVVNVRFRTPPTSLPAGSVVTRGNQSVVSPGMSVLSGDTLSAPARTGGYFPGEEVEVSLTAALGGTGLPHVFRYRTAAGVGPGTFSGGSVVSVDTQPVGVAVGDVDGDGDLDLLSANYSSSTVSVRLNDGRGTFSGTQTVSVGSGPISVVVGDVDGDGDLDLLSANRGSGSVSVRLNNGSGTFSGTQNVRVGGSPISVMVGDVDGDGDLDLLSANGDSSGVSVRLNDGAGNFSGTQDVSVGTQPASVAVGDVDGDGDLDLLTANSGSNNVSVRLNGGSGTFSGTQNVRVGAFPQSAAVGDVDGDGDLDLLSANGDSSGVSVRLNDGAGNFSGTQNVSVGAQTASVAVGDVDGDGDLDLLSANVSGNTVSVRLNNDSGIFSGTQDVIVGSEPYSVAVGDVDGDGDLDLLTANRGSGSVSVRLNQP